MKKLVLLLIFCLLIPSVIAICCQNIGSKEGGCYPGRGICCEETDKVVGYIGCKYTTNKCPGEYLGPCLQCSTNCKPDGTDCNWVEVDKCSGLSCVITYLSGTKTPSAVSECTNKCGEGEVMDIVNNKCVKVEPPTEATCTNDMCASNKYCCAPDGTKKEGKGSVCSGDYDSDDICNIHDNSPNNPNSGTLGTCLPLTIKKTCKIDADCGQGGHCSNNQEDSDRDGIGDASDIEERCESAYSDRQCCDTLNAKAAQNAAFYGYTEDCPQSLGKGIGCWSKCAITDEQGNEINFDISPCIDGQRTVTRIQNGKSIGTPTKEPCSGIPLIPFFTSFNLIFTLLILTLFYYSREK